VQAEEVPTRAGRDVRRRFAGGSGNQVQLRRVQPITAVYGNECDVTVASRAQSGGRY